MLMLAHDHECRPAKLKSSSNKLKLQYGSMHDMHAWNLSFLLVQLEPHEFILMRNEEPIQLLFIMLN